jgi:hypothetical protein
MNGVRRFKATTDSSCLLELCVLVRLLCQLALPCTTRQSSSGVGQHGGWAKRPLARSLARHCLHLTGTGLTPPTSCTRTTRGSGGWRPHWPLLAITDLERLQRSIAIELSTLLVASGAKGGL